MSRAFAETLADLAKEDPRIVLLSADLGFMALESFIEKFPDRFFNVGVAEQNMLGLATGLAEAGFVPFAYSIVTFAVLRPFEFIRNGPVAHRLPVRIVSVGGGLEYSHNGISHYGLEDVALMRSQPNMTIVCPCDAPQARAAVRVSMNIPGPVYLRLAKDNTDPVSEGRFELGRVDQLRSGSDAALIALGPLCYEAMAAADELARRGIKCGVISVPSITGLTSDSIATAVSRLPLVVTAEAHYVTGGLGSLVSEVVAERNFNCRVVRCGVQRLPDGKSGSKSFLQNAHGISAEALVEVVARELKGKQNS
jgi:transketolase